MALVLTLTRICPEPRVSLKSMMELSNHSSVSHHLPSHSALFNFPQIAINMLRFGPQSWKPMVPQDPADRALALFVDALLVPTS
jgi:hypothetical protein